MGNDVAASFVNSTQTLSEKCNVSLPSLQGAPDHGEKMLHAIAHDPCASASLSTGRENIVSPASANKFGADGTSDSIDCTECGSSALVAEWSTGCTRSEPCDNSVRARASARSVRESAKQSQVLDRRRVSQPRGRPKTVAQIGNQNMSPKRPKTSSSPRPERRSSAPLERR